MQQDDDLRDIADEIKRQYDVVLKMDDSLDTKISIVLGFVFLTLSQIALNKDFVGLVLHKYPFLFGVGLILIIISIIAGVIAYSLREYGHGSSPDWLFTQYKEGKSAEFINMNILGTIKKDVYDNKNNSKSKAQWVKVMFITFAAGLIILVLLEVASLY